MKDLAAHIPATLEQHGHYEQAQGVRNLYAAVKKLAAGRGAEETVVAGIQQAATAVNALAPDQRLRVGEAVVKEMDEWLQKLADRYLQSCIALEDLDKAVKSGGNPDADLSAEHGALATLLDEVLR